MIGKEVLPGIDRNQAAPIATIAQDARPPPSVGTAVRGMAGIIASRDFMLFMMDACKYRSRTRGN